MEKKVKMIVFKIIGLGVNRSLIEIKLDSIHGFFFHDSSITRSIIF